MRYWKHYLRPADEWLINYAIQPSGSGPNHNLVSVTTFSVGHAIELYLKATYVKIIPASEQYSDLVDNHKLARIWKACAAQDPSFMPSFLLIDKILDMENSLFTHGEILDKLRGDESKNYAEHQELYKILKFIGDYKYFLAPHKENAKYKVGMMFHQILNPYWLQFFKEIRAYLQYPDVDDEDKIKAMITEGCLPMKSANYLSQLYNINYFPS
jgi:hypothetical protein